MTRTELEAMTIGEVFTPATLHTFLDLYAEDGDGHSVAWMINDRLSAGVIARQRSIKYAKDNAEARKAVSDNARNEELFSRAVLENPAVLRDKDALLSLAAKYDVKTSRVLEMLTKAAAKNVA